jgi:short-subunit dehydrogenase
MWLKALEEQVIVVTGASSGIGRTTARLAAAAGARVVLAARDQGALGDAEREIREAGGEATVVRCDVTEYGDVQGLAEAAVRAYGGFDTWVNNAGASIYGRLDEVPLADMRRLMDVNFWGVVHGSRVAAAQLRRTGGALVNVGSVLSDRAIPLQGMYCATKHAVQGFTDALRMELEEAGAPVSVSLVKPASIGTPFYDVARNYMDVAPRPVPPVYAPEVAARAILRCATHPTRELYAGGAGKGLALGAQLAPRLTDRAMERMLFTMQRHDARPETAPEGNLYDALDLSAERGTYGRDVRERSAYTTATSHPALSALFAVGVGLAVLLGTRGAGSPHA